MENLNLLLKSYILKSTLVFLFVLILPQFSNSQIQRAKNKSALALSSTSTLSNSSTNQQNISTIRNFNKNGLQITRFDSVAAAIDAHDGEIALFNGIYYLYGTSYDCGFEWGNKDAPFCGFKAYSSNDLVNWTDRGYLFDATTAIWQTRCNGNTYGCFRPHIIYNQKNNLYVLWINVYDNRVGFRVFTSLSPVGPFTEVAVPTLAVNNNAAIAGLNNGDHDTFVDDDNTAYIAYTDWKTGGSIVIEKLNADYTSGTGQYQKSITQGQTEAPSLMKRNGIYYLLYSDPNCGYCSGTGTSYRTATSPLGSWSNGIKISTNSCGGQPSFVSTLKINSDVIFLYGSDLWNNGAKNESLANYYWSPLTFASDGSINPIVCKDTVNVSILPDKFELSIPPDLDNTSGVEGFTTYSDIGRNIQRSQSFVTTRSGILSAVSFTTFKSDHPNAGLKIEIYKANPSYLPVGNVLSSSLVNLDSISWSPKEIFVYPNIKVDSAARYTIVVKSAATVGSFGLEYNDLSPYPGGGATYSSTSGSSFVVEKNRTLMFKTFIHPDNLLNSLSNETDTNFIIYPNPITNYFTIFLQSNTSASTLKIFETSGKEVFVKNIIGTGSKKYEINMSAYSNGVYMLKFKDGEITKTLKIIKT